MQIADITVKKADGTTDVVYTAITGAAGDGAPAIWHGQSQGSTVATHPKFEVRSAWNGPKTARRVSHKFEFPVELNKDGIITVTDKVIGEGSILVPQNLAETNIKERVYQYTNLLAAALIKEAMASGFAPR